MIFCSNDAQLNFTKITTVQNFFLFSLEGSVFHIFVSKSHTFHGCQPNSVILGMLFFEKAVMMMMMTYKGDGEGQFEIIL